VYVITENQHLLFGDAWCLKASPGGIELGQLHQYGHDPDPEYIGEFRLGEWANTTISFHNWSVTEHLIPEHLFTVNFFGHHAMVRHEGERYHIIFEFYSSSWDNWPTIFSCYFTPDDWRELVKWAAKMERTYAHLASLYY
jgi:hypothetical protein